MNRTGKSFSPAIAAVLTFVSSLVVLRFPSSLDSELVLASSFLILLPLLFYPHLFHPGEHFLILAPIKTSIEHQIMLQQIVYDPSPGQVIMAPSWTTR